MTSTPLTESRQLEKQRQKQRETEDRVTRVLDATESFAMRATHVEDLTPALIAELSQVSVGWLYQHIGDRQAVVDLVLLRGMKAVQEAVITVGLDLSAPNWHDGVDLLVDSVVNLLRTRRGYARLYYSRLAGPSTPEINFQIDQEISRTFSLSPLGVPTESEATVATVMNGLIDKGLELSFRLDEFETPGIMAETKVAVKAYLGHYAR